jgi:hypothetical protein
MLGKKIENLALYEQLKVIIQNYYRPFRIREVFSLLRFFKQEANINTLRKYFQYLEKDGLIIKTDWSNYARDTYYLPTNSVLKPIETPFVFSHKYKSSELFTTFLDPIDLIELTSLYRYLPFNKNTVTKDLFNWYDKISYQDAYDLLPYEIRLLNIKPVIIYAYAEDLHNLNIHQDKKDISKNRITFNFNTKQQRTCFFSLDGEKFVEILRKVVLILSIKNNMDLSKISDYLQSVMVNMVIDYEKDGNIRREKLEYRFSEINRPDPPEIKRFKNNMIDYLDLEIKTIEIKKNPEKLKILTEFNSEISLKEDQAKKLAREINKIKKNKKDLLNEE